MPEFDNKDMIFLAVFWSLLILGVGVGVGHSWSQKDCGTCEAALDKAIDELHTCQEERLTQVGSRCEDERQAERKRCKVTLSQYKTSVRSLFKSKSSQSPFKPSRTSL